MYKRQRQLHQRHEPPYDMRAVFATRNDPGTAEVIPFDDFGSPAAWYIVTIGPGEVVPRWAHAKAAEMKTHEPSAETLEELAQSDPAP